MICATVEGQTKDLRATFGAAAQKNAMKTTPPGFTARLGTLDGDYIWCPDLGVLEVKRSALCQEIHVQSGMRCCTSVTMARI
eukprot:107105-Amphidinium_carterae.1